MIANETDLKIIIRYGIAKLIMDIHEKLAKNIRKMESLASIQDSMQFTNVRGSFRDVWATMNNTSNAIANHGHLSLTKNEIL